MTGAISIRTSFKKQSYYQQYLWKPPSPDATPMVGVTTEGTPCILFPTHQPEVPECPHSLRIYRDSGALQSQYGTLGPNHKSEPKKLQGD